MISSFTVMLLIELSCRSRRQEGGGSARRQGFCVILFVAAPHQMALQHINFCTVQLIAKLPTGSPKMMPTWLFHQLFAVFPLNHHYNSRDKFRAMVLRNLTPTQGDYGVVIYQKTLVFEQLDMLKIWQACFLCRLEIISGRCFGNSEWECYEYNKECYEYNKECYEYIKERVIRKSTSNGLISENEMYFSFCERRQEIKNGKRTEAINISLRFSSILSNCIPKKALKFITLIFRNTPPNPKIPNKLLVRDYSKREEKILPERTTLQNKGGCGTLLKDS
ncbi:uncharacterized protein TNCV_1373361 [Trichonephila clavipes]|uniref:Uncharacterized protein n=1 Tax=Trichonephila clavipes TaxID=2585209 RepID=A0A8X6WH15_TRICX|nr:uncharacterized protein TNCV_1373361 [Trichonephila clavipes]